MLKPDFEYRSIRRQKLQNKAMRSIKQLNRFTSITFMLVARRWLNVRKRRKSTKIPNCTVKICMRSATVQTKKCKRF